MDLARDLAQSPIVDARVTSTAAIHYRSNGAKSFPKERIECFVGGKSVVIDNWRRLHRFGVLGGSRWFEHAGKMDKGHAAEIAAWVRAVREGSVPPIPLGELLELSRWAIRAGEMAASPIAPTGARSAK